MPRFSVLVAAAVALLALAAVVAPAHGALTQAELRAHASSILHDESLHPGDREAKHAMLAQAAAQAVAAGVVSYPVAADGEVRGPIDVVGTMMNPHVSEDERIDALLELHELVALRESPEHHRRAGVVVPVDTSLIEVSAEAQASEALFAKAGLSLKVLAVLGFTNGVIDTLFLEATWYNLKICLTDPGGRFQQSAKVTAFSAAWDACSAAISGTVAGPISMEDIFAQFSRPQNGVYKYQNKEGTPLYYRQVRNAGAWRQLMDTYDAKSGKPAPSCYEWSPDMQVWMPSSTLEVSSGYWKGQKPVPVNQDLIKWLQEFCPTPKDLSVEDLGFLFGFPDSNGVYSYTAGFAKGQRIFYRHNGGRWEWSANFGLWDGRADTWYPVSMRSATKNSEAAFFDHIEVLKLLDSANPTPLQLSAGNLRMLGLPDSKGVFTYDTALFFGTTYEFRREANAWQWRKKDAAWAPASAWASIDASHTSVRLLVKQLAQTNPAAPTAGAQTRMQASAWQATGFLEWAKRVKRAVVDVIATMPGFLSETYTSLTACSAEVKKRCFPAKGKLDVMAADIASGITTPAPDTAAPPLTGATGEKAPDNSPEDINDDFSKVMSKLDAELSAASTSKAAAPASTTAVAGAGKPASAKAATTKAATAARRTNLVELRAEITALTEAEATDEATANDLERHLATAPEKTDADIKKTAEKSVTELTQSEFHLADMSAGQLDELLALANDDLTKSTAVMCRKMREELTTGAMFIGVSEAFVTGMALQKYMPRTFRVLIVWPAKYGLGAPYWGFKGLVFLAKKNAKMAVGIAKLTANMVKLGRTAKYGFLVTKLVYRRLARRVLAVVPRAMRFWIAKVGVKILARAANPLLMLAFYGVNVAMNWKPLSKAVNDWSALHAKMAAEGRKTMTQDESWENVRLWGFVITKVVIG